MRNRNRRWILFWFLVSILQLVFSDVTENANNSTNNEDNTSLRGIFSPRMDYDQWKPLGRGDPLQNDPTFDYVPPVLDRVHYWVDPTVRNADSSVHGDNQKTEILLLGITSKKPASSSHQQADSRRDTYDPYVQYVDGAQYNQNENQRIARPSFIPSIPTSFFPSFFPPNKNKFSNGVPFSKGTEQRVPYTVLMPPPLETKNSANSLPSTAQNSVPIVYTTPSSTSVIFSSPSSSVTVQAADLIYQSSSSINESQWKNKHFTIDSSINWQQPSTTKKAAPDFRDAVVYNAHLVPPDSYIRFEFAPHNFTNKPLVASDSNHNINYVTPPPLIKASGQEIMHKGEVTDDNLDISNTYVKIGKTEAEVHSTGLGISNINNIVQQRILPTISSDLSIFPHIMNSGGITNKLAQSKKPPITIPTLLEMQTMHPSLVTQIPAFTRPTKTILQILEKEKRQPVKVTNLTKSPQIPNYTGISNLKVHNFVTPSATTEIINITIPSTTTTTAETATPTTAPATATVATSTDPATSTTASLTTDPLFKHYKQPNEPLRGPLYLIIQGHSKVKTYGPSKQVHGIKVQETNEIPDSYDNYKKGDFEVRHLHVLHKEMEPDDKPRRARSGNIQTLKHVVQTGFGAIDFSGIDEMKRRIDEDYQEAELHAGYEISDDNGVTEKYYKGTVEEARKLKV